MEHGAPTMIYKLGPQSAEEVVAILVRYRIEFSIRVGQEDDPHRYLAVYTDEAVELMSRIREVI